jgi:hypothetical protein
VASGRRTVRGGGGSPSGLRGGEEGDGDGVDGPGGCAAARILRQTLALPRRLWPVVRRGLLLGPAAKLRRFFFSFFKEVVRRMAMAARRGPVMSK